MSESTTSQNKQTFPPQHQTQQPGIETQMTPNPESVKSNYIGSGKLAGKTAIITGGDSGIGRSVAIYFAKEGANIAISYLNEDNDAATTKELIEKEGQKCILLPGDIGDEAFCQNVIAQTIQTFGRIRYSRQQCRGATCTNEPLRYYRTAIRENISYQYFFHVLFNEGCPALFEKR